MQTAQSEAPAPALCQPSPPQQHRDAAAFMLFPPTYLCLLEKLNQRPQLHSHADSGISNSTQKLLRELLQELPPHTHQPSHLCLLKKLNQRPQLQRHGSQQVNKALQLCINDVPAYSIGR